MITGASTLATSVTSGVGASGTQSFFRITVPMLRPVLLFMIITSTIGLINLYAQVKLLTNGGPQNNTYTLFMRMMDLIANNRFGEGTSPRLRQIREHHERPIEQRCIDVIRDSRLISKNDQHKIHPKRCNRAEHSDGVRVGLLELSL